MSDRKESREPVRVELTVRDVYYASARNFNRTIEIEREDWQDTAPWDRKELVENEYLYPWLNELLDVQFELLDGRTIDEPETAADEPECDAVRVNVTTNEAVYVPARHRQHIVEISPEDWEWYDEETRRSVIKDEIRVWLSQEYDLSYEVLGPDDFNDAVSE